MSPTLDEFESRIHNPHDAAFQEAFRKRELFRALCEAGLPPEVIRHIDLDHLELEKNSFVDEKLKNSHSDVVYRTRLLNWPAFLYILFEHQSTPDPLMAFRLLCYMANVWKDYLAKNPKAKRLPVIIPAVFYHGQRRWRSPTEFADLMECPEELKRFTPNFIYPLIDLNHFKAETTLLGDQLRLRIVLHLFGHIFKDDFWDHFGLALEMLAKVEDETIFMELLEWSLRYAYHARNEDEETLRAFIDRETNKLADERVRRAGMTIAERIRQKGIVEGKSEGREEASTAMLFRQIRRKFGRVPESLEEKVRRSDVELLYEFGEALLDFSDLKEAESWWEKQGPRSTGNA